jgi:hypothetical protein
VGVFLPQASLTYRTPGRVEGQVLLAPVPAFLAVWGA